MAVCPVIAIFPLCRRDRRPCHRDRPPAVISTARERSPSAIINHEKGASSTTRDFSLSHEMTAGGGISALALPGTTRFLASLEMT
ncbi:MAG: hypothetical protein WBN83_13960 [Desulfoprunum sp.]|uniref:hypothetical protein n=1 Tax=Desulfoprunum sp. TaxID=2020866 RepID=UPI000A5602ED